MTQQANDPPAFKGFDISHDTPVPDILFDELLTVLSWDELKVLLYIIRRTRGFKKSEDTISLSQFTDGITTQDGKILDSGCGIKKRSRVSDTLKKLEKGGYIEIVRPKAKTGLITYRLCYKTTATSTRDATDPSQTDARDARDPSLGTQETLVLGTQETLALGTLPSPTRNSLQETVLQETVLQERKNAKASDDQTNPPKSSSRKRSQKGKTQEELIQPSLPQESEKQKPVLSERAQTVFDEWCKQPWFKGVPPKITESVIEHCEKLAKYEHLPTVDEMVKARHWYQKKYPKRQGWYLGNFEDAYPQWLSENYQESPVQTTQESVTQAATKNQTQVEKMRALAEKKMKERKENEHRQQQHQQHHVEGSTETKRQACLGM
jgi:hypothetical protein